ncbi:MAG: hypothetical protein JO205_03445 [Pseudolabrys sp.]|nr:hypothetical protein [Pseudolabrys sp.]MBV9260404.1 hypothetical protein [Pseudolabrys sp.]
MTKIGSFLAVAALAATAVSFDAQNAAQAYCRGCAVGAGVIGGIAAGAIIGGAIANSQAAPVYVAPPPPPPGVAPADVDPNEVYDSAVCHVERVWDEYRQRWIRREICD